MGEAARNLDMGDLGPSSSPRRRATREEIHAAMLADIAVETEGLQDGRWVARVRARGPHQPAAEVIAETQDAASAQVRELAVRLGRESFAAWFESQPEAWKRTIDRAGSPRRDGTSK